MTAHHPEPERPDGAKTVKPRQANGLLIIALIAVVTFFIAYRPDVPAVACDDAIMATQPDVVMLGAWWCRYCARARSYFHENQVHYCEYDIERSEEGRRRYEALDGRSVPVLLFGGKYRIDGYDEVVVERALAMLEREKAGID